MKHGKRPTRRQKQLIKSYGLNCDNWLVVKDCKESFDIVHKHSRELKCYEKFKEKRI